MRAPRTTPWRLTIACALLLAVAEQAPSRAACAEPEDPPVSVDAPTLHVEVHAERSSYHPNQVAVLPVTVRLGAPDGPKGSGARLVITVRRGERKIATLYGETDTTGTARPRLAITPHTPKGLLTATATARIELVSSYDCRGALVYQYGEGAADPLTRIV